MGDIQVDGWSNNDEKLAQTLLAESEKARRRLKSEPATIEEWIEMTHVIHIVVLNPKRKEKKHKLSWRCEDHSTGSVDS